MRRVRFIIFGHLGVLLLAGCSWAATTDTPEAKVAQSHTKTATFLSASIRVFDMDKTVSFFNGLLGLPVLQRFTLEDADIALLGVEGQPSLSFIARPSYAQTRYTGFSIAIEIPSLDDTLPKLNESGYRILREPFSPQPGSRLCFVEGPDGVEVELIENQP